MKLGSTHQCKSSRGQQAFTMVEIAICLAVIGFALVAIIGVLPTGMQVQKENREDTLVNQDGEYFVEAIRNGAQGLNELVGLVDFVQVNGRTYQTLDSAQPNYIDKGWQIIGLLSAPGTNVAVVRAISGPAAESGAGLRDFGFKYQLTVNNTNFVNDAPELNTNINGMVEKYLHDLRLEFRWPLHADGSVGRGRQIFRAMISGDLVNDPTNSDFYFYRQ